MNGRRRGRFIIRAETIQNEIISIISDISGFDTEEITPETHFFEELEIDSIKAIEITVAIEKIFRVSVRDEDVPNIMTVAQAVGMVNKLLSSER